MVETEKRGLFDKRKVLFQKLTNNMFGFIGQSPEEGVWPILYASTSDNAESGIYYGPNGRGERKGSPAKAVVADYAMDAETTNQLWDISEQISGVKWILPVIKSF